MRKPKIIDFIQTAGYLGGGSVLLAVILFGISTWEHIYAENIKSGWLVILGIAAFCYGAYQAWSKERDKFDAERVRSANPDFSLELGQIRYWYDDSVNLTTVLIACSITNHGAPSSAHKWQANIRKQSGQETVGFVNFPGQIYHWPAGNNLALPLHKGEMLPAVTAEAIGTGVTKSGRVLFQLAGNVTNELLWNAATLHIGCVDRMQKATWQGMGPMYPADTIDTFPHEDLIEISQLGITPAPELED